MNDKLFAQLMESLHQGDAILKGEAEPSRRFEVKVAPAETVATSETVAASPAEDAQVIGAAQVRGLRERFGLSQTQFAALLGISAGTLRNWEQGRRAPEGAARVLLRVAAKHPQAVLDANSAF